MGWGRLGLLQIGSGLLLFHDVCLGYIRLCWDSLDLLENVSGLLLHDVTLR